MPKLYITDEAALLAADPDILLTQALCDVWALSAQQVAELGLTLNKNPQVISLDPELLGDVLEDIRRVGRATENDEAAESLTGRLQVRIDAVTERAVQAGHRPKGRQLEWADPMMCGGHWVVEMVERAGGATCFGSKETGSSRRD